MTDPRHRAWDDIHDLLPAGWRVSAPSYDPGVRGWSVTAVAPKRGKRLKPPESLTGTGEDELAALTYLVLALREYNKPGQMAELGRKMRLAYYRGAEEGSQRRLGRGLTTEELEGVIRRGP